MQRNSQLGNSRRSFLKTSGIIAASSLVPTTVGAAADDEVTTHEEKVRRAVKKEKHKSYMRSYERRRSESGGIDSEDTIGTHFELNLGTNDTCYDAKSGDSGKQSSGWTPSVWGSSYDTVDDQAEAAIVTGLLGAGSGTAWAWVGREVVVKGSGSQTANIIGRGDIDGMLTTAGPASCSGSVNLVVIDYTTGGTRYDDMIFSEGDGGYEQKTVDSTFNNGMSMVLEAGHDYMVSLEVEAEVTLAGTGEGGADFGDGDGDGGDNQGVFMNSIEFRF